MAGQLVLPFGVEPALGRESFIRAPCNEQAFQFVARWPDWPARAAALYGPAGSGKTHLASIWRQASGAKAISARELMSETPDLLEQESANLVIEDLDRENPSQAGGRALLALFERPMAWLLLTARTPPSEWLAAVGDLKSRFRSLIAFPMWAPDDALLRGLVAKHFAGRQLDVPDAVIGRIVTQMERTPAAIAAFVARADRKALAEKRAITERLVLELLASEAHGDTQD